MPDVEFSRDNVMKCMCGECPVQADSSCVADKNTGLEEAMTAGLDPMPAQDQVPGLYCSAGTASCTDLNFAELCICGECAVFIDNKLGGWKYCEQGAATAR